MNYEILSIKTLKELTRLREENKKLKEKLKEKNGK